MRKNQTPEQKANKAFKKTFKETKIFLETIQKNYSEDENCSGCNFGALARMKKRQEELMKSTIKEISESNEEKEPRKVKIIVKRKIA